MLFLPFVFFVKTPSRLNITIVSKYKRVTFKPWRIRWTHKLCRGIKPTAPNDNGSCLLSKERTLSENTQTMPSDSYYREPLPASDTANSADDATFPPVTYLCCCFILRWEQKNDKHFLFCRRIAVYLVQRLEIIYTGSCTQFLQKGNADRRWHPNWMTWLS